MASNIEQTVAEVLSARAASVKASTTGTGRVVHRARRKRRLKAALAASAFLPVMVGGVALFAALQAEPTSLDVADGASGDRAPATPSAEPLRFARPVVTGVHEGTPWWLFDSDNSPKCPALGLDDGFRLGSMGPSCSNTIRNRDLHFSRAVVGRPELSDFGPVYGVVGSDIDSVQVVTGGRMLEAEMYRVIDHPELHYFLLFLDEPVEDGQVQALDANGAVANELPLCVPVVEKGRMQVCSEVTER